MDSSDTCTPDMKRGRGRPKLPASERQDARIWTALRRWEKKALRQQAKAEGKKLKDFVRDELRKLIRNPDPERPPTP